MAVSCVRLFASTFILISLSLHTVDGQCDFKRLILRCDTKTRTRSIVYYLNSPCSMGKALPPPVHGIPCDCPPGKGLSGQLDNNVCVPCLPGEYGVGGEVINDWHLWTNNGTTPPDGSGLITFCDTSRNYLKSCQSWKASTDNITIDSGENGKSRCLMSVLLTTKKFVMPESKVSFDYRVDGRKCRSPNYLGCDGLGFFVDNKLVLNYAGSKFVWTTATYNLTTGTHTLRWIYRKRCFSYPSDSFTDKAFIRSISLVGTVEPNVTCSQCPPGYYSNVNGSSRCIPCPYFQYQPQKGQSKCLPCPANMFSMPGASTCRPLLNCTANDIIAAPGNLSTCSVEQDGNFVTLVYPKYITAKGLRGRLLCKPPDSKPLPSRKVLCKCQPGFEIYSDDGKTVKCRACSKGFYSDGTKCTQCQEGHVALPGKHFSVWESNTLPQGFTSKCVGDCPIEGSWIPSGSVMRTARVIGNVDSYLETRAFVVNSSSLAQIMFNCSITCNVSGVSPKAKPVRGENLADIDDCNLVFEVYSNDTLVDQVNCTSPKGKFVYRHDTRRDGTVVQHVYPLKAGNYTFRWVFHQVDESRAMSSAFEGMLYNISVLGVDGGEARNCTACAPGYRSVSGNTDCAICPAGTASSAGAQKCSRCGEGYFTFKNGSEACLQCGNNTVSTNNRDGCDNKGCTFSPTPGVVYDLSRLSRPGGPMFGVLSYQTYRPGPRPWHHGKRPSGLSFYHGKLSFYVNLCTLEHENTSCTYRDPETGLRKSLPTMACRSTWWSRDLSLGMVIGYSAKKDVRSGLVVDLLHGDRCYGGKDQPNNYSTTIDLICDVNAGVGNPGPENNYTGVIRAPCNYYFVWKSLYACPKCRSIDVIQTYSECVNGTRNITYMRAIPCWGPGNGTDLPPQKTEKCEIPTEKVIVNGTVSYLVKKTNELNKVFIGVGVLVIVISLAVAAFFVYKHRVMKYRYYTLMARNKPMSRLEQEDDENFILDDQDPDPFADSPAPMRA